MSCSEWSFIQQLKNQLSGHRNIGKKLKCIFTKYKEANLKRLHIPTIWHSEKVNYRDSKKPGATSRREKKESEG